MVKGGGRGCHGPRCCTPWYLSHKLLQCCVRLRDAGVLKQQHLTGVAVRMMIARGAVRRRLTAEKCQSRADWMKQIKNCCRVAERE